VQAPPAVLVVGPQAGVRFVFWKKKTRREDGRLRRRRRFREKKRESDLVNLVFSTNDICGH